MIDLTTLKALLQAATPELFVYDDLAGDVVSSWQNKALIVEAVNALPALLDRLEKLEERLVLADGLAQSLSTYPPETLYFETCFLLKDYYTAKGLTK